jgi:hypothetical protein
MLPVECTKYARKGLYRVSRLIEKYVVLVLLYDPPPPNNGLVCFPGVIPGGCQLRRSTTLHLLKLSEYDDAR